MPDIAIVATACTTPVGLRSLQTYASVRAGISRTGCFESKGLTCYAAVSAAIPDGCLPEPMEPENGPGLTPIEKRILRLLGSTRQQMAHLDLTDTVLIIGLGQGTVFNRLNDRDILELTAAQIQTTICPQKSRVLKEGRASGLMAIQIACEMLASKKADQVLAGGCDSFHDPELLGRLNIADRLRSATAKDGFVPGEGAGLVLLMTEPLARQKKVPVLAKITSWASGFEPGHLGSDQPCHGNGLTETLQALFDRHAVDKIRSVYASMNAESYWAKEWGTACLRCHNHFNDAASLHHPAEYYGDPGAASGPIMTILAATGLNSNHQQGPALVYAASDHGRRCAVLVES